MRKLISTCFILFLFYILPLLGKPELILSPVMLFLMASCTLLWMSQPELRKKEIDAKKDTDKNTVMLILFLSAPSVMVPVIEWAYYRDAVFAWEWMGIIGLCMIIFGLMLRIWAIRILGGKFTTSVQIVEGHDLVTVGPYSYVRHPSYLGAYMAFAGSAMLLHAYFGLVIALSCMGYAYFRRITTEEMVLVKQFGQAYLDYSGNTKKMIPGVW